MNEIKLLETHGPDGPQLTGAALHAARARLLAEVSAASTAAAVPGRPAPVGRARLFARLAIAGAGLAAVTATAIAAMPAAPPNSTRPPITADGATDTRAGSPERVTLVTVTAPEFPYALPKLGQPSFTADPGGPIFAVYSAPDGSDVLLTTATAGASQQTRGQRDISVGGRPGHIDSILDPSGAVAAVELTWERERGEWVTIIGHRRHASTEAVLQLAGQVVEQPQRIGFKVTLGLVPDGWELDGFKDGGSISLISYRDPGKPNLGLDLQWTPKPDAGRNTDVEGFQRAQIVTINERPAQLIQAAQFWRLTATLPDGSGFMLMTPRSFSADQVIAVARSVRLNRS